MVYYMFLKFLIELESPQVQRTGHEIGVGRRSSNSSHGIFISVK